MLISVGINALFGGKVELVKLLTAGSYISIISQAMQAVTESRQQWKDLCAECKNIDKMFELPYGDVLDRTADGSIVLKDASFGWPVKPPTKYTVLAKDTAITPISDGDPEIEPLEAKETVYSVDGQKNRDSLRVRTEDGKKNGWVKKSALKQLPDEGFEKWERPKASISDVDLRITQGELVLISGPVAGGKSTLLQSLVGNTEMLHGTVAIPKSVAFQPQSPILFDQTIRANILFGIAEVRAACI
eukprot:SAG31_NODE_166_length_21670_cov_22.507719_15_plen_245_part_00